MSLHMFIDSSCFLFCEMPIILFAHFSMDFFTWIHESSSYILDIGWLYIWLISTLNLCRAFSFSLDF